VDTCDVTHTGNPLLGALFVYLEGDRKMGYEKRKRKTGSEQTGAANPASLFVGQHKFINVTLNDQDRNWLSSNDGTLYDCVVELMEALGGEYALRVAYDYKTARFTAMLTCLVNDHANTGFILSMRGSTPADAIYALFYVHVHRSEGLWRSVAPEDKPASRWG